jgi:ATP-binding cassette subfamily F protein uup
MILVDAQKVGASRPGKPLFADLSVTVSTGDRLGIVGLNGCGKSTLLRVLAGVDEPESGQVVRGRGARIAMLDQNPALPPGPALAAVGEGWEAEAVLDHVGMGGFASADTATLSGGQAKRVALARTLVTECDLLVLDEPTNHLDIDAIAWLEDRLAAFRGGLILVTHDRHVLDRVTTKVLELDRGSGYVHDGGYDAYLEGKAEREEQAAADEASRKILARQELAWLRRGAPARTRKSKARIESATRIIETQAQAAARPGALDLTAAGPAGGRGDAPAKGTKGWGSAGIEKRYPGTPRLGDQVVDLHGVGHRYRDERGVESPWLFEGVELLLDPRERLGIVGPNGGGKSTLLDIIAGRLEPLTGTVDRGPTVRLGYYDQVGVTLDLNQRVRDAVAGPTRQPDWQDAALLEQFWFETDAQFAPIGLLSGGERRRLQLLLVLAQKPNVLLLDEPTNDLDIDTLRVMEDYFDEWPGALVVVSHDRAFLERTVEDVVVVDGHGSARRQAGGYAGWEQARRAARGTPARSAATTKAPKAAGSTGGTGAAASAPAAPKAKAKGSGKGGSPTPQPPGRSPSTLRRLIKDTEKDTARLTKRKDKLEAELAELALTADHTVLTEKGTVLAGVVGELAAAEERWLELSDELDRALAAR